MTQHPHVMPGPGIVPSYATGPAASGPYVPPAIAVPSLCNNERSHDALWPCPLHGCPTCAVDRFEWTGEDWEFPAEVDPDSALGWTLTAVYEQHTDETSCRVCSEILTRSRWAHYPGTECEDTCTLAHCSECQSCGKAGNVCRRCSRCQQHQDSGSSACEVTKFDPRSGETRTLGFSHEFWNPATGRWGR